MIVIETVQRLMFFSFRFFTLMGSLRRDTPTTVNLIEKENLQTSMKFDHFCEGLRVVEKHVSDNFNPQNRIQPKIKVDAQNIRGL